MPAWLLLPLVGFLPVSDKRIKATVREIEEAADLQGAGGAL
jgi:GH15 family glucan-1,4-alpha-glucosidase